MPVFPKFGVCVAFMVDPKGDDEPNVDDAALFVIVLPTGFTLALNGATGADV